MRRPSAFDVRRIGNGIEPGGLDQNIAAAEADFAFGAAHHAARWPRRAMRPRSRTCLLRACARRRRACGFFRRARARRTTMRCSAELIEIERVQRLAELEHHVVRHVHHVVDRILRRSLRGAAAASPAKAALSLRAERAPCSGRTIRAIRFRRAWRPQLFRRIP